MKKRSAAGVLRILLLAAGGFARFSGAAAMPLWKGRIRRAGETGQGEYKIFSVVTESGKRCLIRGDVEYRRYLLQIGPECRVLGIAARSDGQTAWAKPA